MADPSWESFAAGYASGCAGLLIGHPLDSLKVLIQTSASGESPSAAATAAVSRAGRRRPMAQSSVLPPLHLESLASMQRRYLLTADFAASAARRSALQSAAAAKAAVSIRTLYNGISTPLVTVGAVQSINFALYDAFRRLLHARSTREGDYRSDGSLAHISLAAFASGGIVSLITGPLVALKVRQQATGWSLREAASRSMVAGGARNLYAGYPVHFLCDSLGRAVFFASYERIKRGLALRRAGGGDGPPASTIPERMLAAALSGVLAWTAIFPLDAVRTRVYSQSAAYPDVTRTTTTAESALEVAREMWTAQGARAFTRGYALAAARSGPVSAVALPVYDLTLDYLNGMS